jgi:hypothetical protein
MLAPVWTDQNLPGLRSARENIADNSIHLSITPATPSAAGLVVAYFIYGGEFSPGTIPDFISFDTEIDIPNTVFQIDWEAGNNWAYSVTAGNGSLVDSTGLTEIASGVYLYPDRITTALNFSSIDTELVIGTETGYPPSGNLVTTDGRVISYDGYTTGTGPMTGTLSLLNITQGIAGTPVLPDPLFASSRLFLWKGIEAQSSTVFAIPSCGLTRPAWIDQRHIGLERVEDLGDGYSVNLFWDFATVPDGFSEPYYNVYTSSSTYQLYSGPPHSFAAGSPVRLSGFRPDAGYSFGVRAAYFLADFATAGMQTVGGATRYPDRTQLTADLIAAALSTIDVASTTGYPDAGLLVIGREVVRYSSKTSTSFVLSGRDVFGIGRSEDLPAGTSIEMFRGVEEQNPYFWRMTTSWDSSGVTAIPVPFVDGYFQNLYLQDDDGYRHIPVADFNENHDNVVVDAAAADPYNYCGLRNNDPSQFLGGAYCAPSTVHGTGSYHGNSMLGQAGGIDIFEGNLARQELLLGVTGEPFVLLRRKWTGKTCPRTSHRNEHPDGRCGLCFSTSFEGGYDRFINTRLIRPSETNPNGFVQMRVTPYADEVDLIDTRGFSLEKTDISAWLPAIPTVRDRDILIRYTFDFEAQAYTEEFRYEVLTVRRNKINLGKDGAQHITMKRLNVTEEIYKFPVNLI